LIEEESCTDGDFLLFLFFDEVFAEDAPLAHTAGK